MLAYEAKGMLRDLQFNSRILMKVFQGHNLTGSHACRVRTVIGHSLWASTFIGQLVVSSKFNVRFYGSVVNLID